MEKTRKIILMLDSSRAADRGVIRGVVEYSHLRGNWTFYQLKPLFRTGPFSKAKSDNILKRLKNLDADGMIGYLPVESQFRKTIIQRRFPAVVIPVHEPIDGIINIQQNPQVGTIAAEFILDRGFRNFAFCGTKEYWSRIRLVGFTKRVEKAGFSVKVYPLSRERKSRDIEINRLAQWLRKLPKPIGIMTCNDERSADVSEACHLVGIKIPDHVAILGVDNDEMICTLSSPPLSSIQLNFEKVGYQAADMVDHLIVGKKVENPDILFNPTTIVNRQSTDILAMEDEEIATAVRFIRNNARRNIHVKDVVNQSALSIRALQQRFRKTLDRSINQEIRRVRIQQFAQMLLNTNHSVHKIAYDLQFDDINHISRVFRREMGITPIEYRKQFNHT